MYTFNRASIALLWVAILNSSRVSVSAFSTSARVSRTQNRHTGFSLPKLAETRTKTQVSLLKRKNNVEVVGFDEFLEEKRRKNIIANCRLFENLDKGEQARLVAVLEVIESDDMSIGKPVVKQGEIGDAMYFVDSGSFECYDEKTGQVFKVCQPGEFFGELALLFEDKRAASVRPTSKDAKLLKLSKKDFELSMQGRESFSKSLVTEDSSYDSYFEMKRRHQALTKCPLFRKMTPDDLDRIVKAMTAVQVKPGEVVIKQGDQGFCMYFVNQGVFECYDENTGKVLLVCEEFDFFGELALIFQQQRAASVRGAANATTPLVLWQLNKAEFLDAVQESPLFESAVDLIKEKYRKGMLTKRSVFWTRRMPLGGSLIGALFPPFGCLQMTFFLS